MKLTSSYIQTPPRSGKPAVQSPCPLGGGLQQPLDQHNPSHHTVERPTDLASRHVKLGSEPPIPRARGVVAGFDKGTSTDAPMGTKASVGPNGALFQEFDPQCDDFEEPWPPSTAYRFDGLPTTRDLPTNVREAWVSQLGITPRDFFKTLFDTPRVQLGQATVEVNSNQRGINNMDVCMDLRAPGTGRFLGHMDREFHFPQHGPPEVHHNLFDLSREAQGQGIAKDLLANSVKLYDQAGIKKIEVCASLGVGGYAWAKYGFTPKPGQQTRQLFGAISSRLERMPGVPDNIKAVVSRMLESDEPKAIWAISDLSGVKVRSGGREMPLGKALLMGTTWKGTLALDDPQARARFDQYVGNTAPAKSGEDQFGKGDTRA